MIEAVPVECRVWNVVEIRHCLSYAGTNRIRFKGVISGREATPRLTAGLDYTVEFFFMEFAPAKAHVCKRSPPRLDNK